jgi:hypothetical protein
MTANQTSRTADETMSVDDRNEIAEHLLQVPGSRRDGEGVRGSGSRRGSAQRPGGAGLPATLAADLVMTGIVNGAERWASPDGSTVEYRAAGSTLRFHSWKRSTFFGYWSMGSEISTSGSDFEAAVIDSQYYMSVSSPCQVVQVDQDSDRNDDYLDEYEWGWNAQQPERVASLCRAQWRHARFADLLTAGSGCPNYPNDAWPVGFPADWPSDAGVELRPDRISMSTRSVGVVARGSVSVVNLDPNDQQVHVEAGPNADEFELPVGDFTLPGNGSLPLRVTFFGGTAPGIYLTSMQVVVAGRTFTVPIKATVTQVGPPL